MQVDYRRDIHHNYLILSGGEEPDTSSYQVRMLMANQIAGFLPCRIQQIDQKTLFYYDVTSRQTLRSMLEYLLIRKEVIELLLEQIAGALEQIRNYLLDLDGFLLGPEFIYLDAACRKLWFCYYPGNALSFQQQIRELSEYLLPRLEHQDRGAVMLGYAFYQKCVEETMTADVFRELLHDSTVLWQEEPEKLREIPRLQDAGQETEERKTDQEREEESRKALLDAFFSPDEPERPERTGGGTILQKAGAFGALLLPLLLFAGFFLGGRPLEGALLAGGAAGMELAAFVVRRTLKESREREKETEARLQNSRDEEEQQEERKEQREQENGCAFSAEEETVFLGGGSAEGSQSCRGCLLPEGRNKEGPVWLKKDIHLIGKDKEAADVTLDSPAVSRLHARLIWDGESYLISDLNSRNGTDINGRLLEPGEEYRLESGDRIRLADLTFCFEK
jgi:hypothetical protein